MTSPDWEQILRDELDRYARASLSRTLRTITPIDATHVEHDGRRYINFASNNYLGLTHHPRVIGAMRDAIERYGYGSGAAGLITGHGPLHAAAEAALAKWKGTEAALLLPSGYQANHAVVQTLVATAGRRAVFYIDKLVHASIVDAVRASGAAFRVFPHNHLAKLRRLLSEREPDALAVVLTESIFSMDGDSADLAGLAAMKRELPFLLVVDEAHATGVYGAGGAGLANEQGVSDAVDISVITLSKSLGGMGGAVCASELFKQAMLHLGRAYIFSTSVAPAVAAGAIAALDVMKDEPERQARVRELARRVRNELAAAGFNIPQGNSPIIPIIAGGEALALKFADDLRSAGLMTVAVRPPTVPKGKSRVRITLSSEHSDDEIEQLVDEIKKRNYQAENIL